MNDSNFYNYAIIILIGVLAFLLRATIIEYFFKLLELLPISKPNHGGY